ncbi:MAG: hypothetical protein KA792_03750 [Bacteroidales bacterium]|nr:hypothetical protein [Bacteroidales bacterium]
MRIFPFILFILIAAIIISCKHDTVLPKNYYYSGPCACKNNDSTNIPDTSQIHLKPCDPDTAYFQNQIFPIIESNCVYCHNNNNASDGVNLSSYAKIIKYIKKANASDSKLYEIISTTEEDDRMPPDKSLSKKDIDLIALWIKQGGLDNCCDDCDTNKFSFSKEVFPTLSNYCISCHQGQSPSAGIALDNYSKIVNA